MNTEQCPTCGVDVENHLFSTFDECEKSKSDSWEAIEAQLNHWAEMDVEYWRQRKEREYKAWMKRTYGI